MKKIIIDCHKIWTQNDKHWSFGGMSNFINQKILEENYKII